MYGTKPVYKNIITKISNFLINLCIINPNIMMACPISIILGCGYKPIIIDVGLTSALTGVSRAHFNMMLLHNFTVTDLDLNLDLDFKNEFVKTNKVSMEVVQIFRFMDICNKVDNCYVLPTFKEKFYIPGSTSFEIYGSPDIIILNDESQGSSIQLKSKFLIIDDP
jgi:hypothetical protein